MGGNLDMLQVLCSVPDMSTEDTQVSNEELSELHIMKYIYLQAAIEAAHNAFQTWQHTTAKERYSLVFYTL